MPESSEFDERRQHQRIHVSSGVIAVLITSSPEIIGSVSDISVGGARLTYHDPQNKDLNYSNLRVDLISDDRFVEAIPCINAWDCAVKTGDLMATEDLRQCGIQFEGLTPNQLFLLKGFINRCATPGHSLEVPPDVLLASSQ